MSMRTLSWFIEAAKTSSPDQNLQRTVEQIIEDCMDDAISQVMEKISEVREAGLPERTLEKLCEQGGVIEAAETSSRSRNLQSTVEQDFVEVDKATPQERISRRSLALEKCRCRQKYPSGANF